MSHSIPHFIIGGSPRSGTGWMLSCLLEHEKVFIPEHEINYFNNKKKYSPDWYLESFEGAQATQKIGEKSPQYLFNSRCADRIYEWNPEVKLIFSLRNPISRAYSHYCMSLRGGHVSSQIDDELTPDSRIVQYGRYFERLQPYLNRFADDQLCVLIFDDLKANPRQFAADLYQSIGVNSPSAEPSVLNQKFGRTKKRGGAVWDAIRNLSISLSSRSSLASDAVQWLRRRGYTEWIHQLRPGKDDPPMTDGLRRKLADYYRDDVEALSDYLNRDLRHWLD